MLWKFIVFSIVLDCLADSGECINIFKYDFDSFERKYGVFTEKMRKEMLEEAKKMFYFAYDSYMQYAFPHDELDPIHCRGRGPDFENPSNININDVLGDYCLSLVDSLDTLAVLGNATEFKRAVKLVIEHVSFDKDSTIQVFEANIRLLGALLSAHLLITDSKKPFGDLVPEEYDKELLDLASDLATRLLPAFENTKTGIPYPRVNLRDGVPEGCTTHTCTAGAGTLLLEFGILSRILGDPVFEGMARRANAALWKFRSESTGLLGSYYDLCVSRNSNEGNLGNIIDIQSGRWISKLSGLGAGLDSFYEYLLKSYILFGEDEDYRMFNESYHIIKQYLRRGRPHCNRGSGDHPLYVNVDMNSGNTQTTWIDSLQAAFSGVQVLSGDIEEAICAHALYYSIWRMYGALPERFNWQKVSADVWFYPLRPELVESTYLLYQATKNPFYMHVGRDILYSINNHTRSQCGYATIHNVADKSLEDRMESFFLSETCKYLYLLFDKDNYVNTHASEYIFSTEGHLFPLGPQFRQKSWSNVIPDEPKVLTSVISHDKYYNSDDDKLITNADKTLAVNYIHTNQSYMGCERIDEERQFFLPLKKRYFSQVLAALGLEH